MKTSHVVSTVTFFAAAFLFACSPGANDEQKGTLTVSFPSTNAAISSDTLELHVLDGSSSTACLDAVRARQAAPGKPPAATLFDIPATDTCKFLQNQVKPFDMGYGARAFLVVAQKAGTDFLIGCSIAGIGDVSNQVSVDLVVVDKTTDVPQSTKCTKLSDKCGGGTSCF